MTPEANLVIQANNEMLIRGNPNPYYKSRWEWERAVREKNKFIEKQEKLLSLGNAKQDKQLK